MTFSVRHWPGVPAAALAVSALALLGCRFMSEGVDAVRPGIHVVPAEDWQGTRRSAVGWFFQMSASASSPPSTARPAAESAAPTPAAANPGWVLHIGDSFVNSLYLAIEPKFRATGTHVVVRQQQSTYTTTWAYKPELDEQLARHPSLVIVTLGANEFDIEMPEQHARAIERIAHKIASVHAACVWTAPPMWRPDTGISRVIHDHCAPCLFFDSDALLGGLTEKERKPDHIHPNERGGARWADALWRWLADHRDHSSSAARWALTPFESREF